MHRTARVARVAQRRALARALVERAGLWLTVGSGAAAGLALLAKLAPVGPWWWWVGVPVGAGALIAAGLSWRGRWSLAAAAVELDRTLKLKDRLATGLLLEKGGRSSDPFAGVAVADAEVAACTADPRRAVPIRWGWPWGVWPMLLAGAIVTGVYLPQQELFGSTRQRQEEAAKTLEERRVVASAISDAVRLVKEQPPEPAAPEASPRDLAVLEELERDLLDAKTNPDQAREQGARALANVASGLEERSEADRRSDEALREKLASAGAAAPGGEQDSTLSRAVRRGDIAGARGAAETLMRGLNQMSEEERRQLAEDLAQLAQDLEEVANAKPTEPPQPEEPADATKPPAPGPTESPQASELQIDPSLAEDLRRQGLTPEQLRDAAEQITPDQAQRKLEELGIDPETARELAERLEKDLRERQADEVARERTEDLARSLQEAAESLQDGPQDEPQPPPQSAPEQQDQTPEDTRPQAPPEPKPSGEQSKPGDAQRQSPDRQPSQTGKPEGARPAPTPQPSEQQQGAKPDERPGQQTDPKGAGESPRPQPGAKPQPAPGQDQPADQQGAKRDRQGQPRPSGREGGKQDQPTPGDRPAPSESPRPGADGAKPQPQPGGDKGPGQHAPKPSDAAQGDVPKPSPSDPADAPGAREQAPGAPQPGQRPGELPGGGQPMPSEGLGEGELPDEKALEKLADRLKDLEKLGREAEKNEQLARRLRERAKELLDNASPETRERLARWAEQVARERGLDPTALDDSRPQGGGAGSEPGRNRLKPAEPAPPTHTDIVDARSRDAGERPRGDNERVVAEWLGDGKTNGAGPAPAEVQERLQRARDSAERAMEDRTVSRRYDRLLKRYFEALPQKIAPKQAQPETAKDAGVK